MQAAINTLADAGIESARLDAQLLLAHVVNKTREEILLDPPTLTPAQQQEFNILITRRANREPLSHLIGKREFYGREFIVTADVLDPRPDSETLIEQALRFFSSPASGGRATELTPLGVSAVGGGTLPSPTFVTLTSFANKTCPLPLAGEVKILDIGTGSGCLLLTLLAELPKAQGTGIDISPKALAIAQKNATQLGLSARATFQQMDLGSLGFPHKFDLIVSNPPYIATGEIGSLMPEVAQFEPKLALDGGKDGLDCYRKLANSMPALLAPHGVLLLEIGSTQADAVSALVREGGLHVEAVANDLAGKARCIVANHP